MEEQVIIFLAFFCLVGYIIKVVSDNKLRRRIIEKGEINENVKDIFAPPRQRTAHQQLKWGMVLIAVGLGLVFGAFFNSGEIAFAFMLIFAGVALILYYLKGDKIHKEDKNIEQKQSESSV
ncbi:hypothetical protein AMJ80_10800 [bacterium SM23_31]|nr:MAG: hypothetical protein AMJ80_10800 [bacterium SM23_31]